MSVISLRQLVSSEFQEAFKKVSEASLSASDALIRLRWAKKMDSAVTEVRELHSNLKLQNPDLDPLADPQFLLLLEQDSNLGKLPESILTKLELTLRESVLLENVFDVQGGAETK